MTTKHFKVYVKVPGSNPDYKELDGKLYSACFPDNSSPSEEEIANAILDNFDPEARSKLFLREFTEQK